MRNDEKGVSRRSYEISKSIGYLKMSLKVSIVLSK